MKPSHQTIVLRLAYMPDDQQDKPADWRWPVLLEGATNEVTASDTLTIVEVVDEDGCSLMSPTPFSSEEWATAFMSGLLSRERNLLYALDCSQPPGKNKLEFASLSEVREYARKLGMTLIVQQTKIDPVYGEE